MYNTQQRIACVRCGSVLARTHSVNTTVNIRGVCVKACNLCLWACNVQRGMLMSVLADHKKLNLQLFWPSINRFSSASMSNLCWFRLLKLKDLLFFSIIYDCKWRVFGFWTAGLRKETQSHYALFINRLKHSFGVWHRRTSTQLQVPPISNPASKSIYCMSSGEC